MTPLNPLNEDEILMLPAYAVSDEVRSSARYRWSCQDRGPVPFVILQATRSGCGRFRCAGRDAPVPAGRAFLALVPEDAEYRFAPGARDPWRFSWINFYGALSLRLWATVRAAAGPVFPLAAESDAGRRLERLIVDVQERRFADRYAAAAEAYAFFGALCRQLGAPAPASAAAPGAPHSLQTAGAIRRLAAQPIHGPPLGIKTFASQAGLSREHFSRVFKAHEGVTPGRFLRLRRLRAADELLRTTLLPLKEIALRCGFSSARHFSDAYRDAHGHPPQQTRGLG